MDFFYKNSLVGHFLNFLYRLTNGRPQKQRSPLRETKNNEPTLNNIQKKVDFWTKSQQKWLHLSKREFS